MSPQDKKKLAIGVGLLVLAFVILYFTVLRRSGGALPTTPTTTATAPTETGTAATGTGAAPATAPAAGATAPTGLMTAGLATGGGAEAAAPVAAGAPLNSPPGAPTPGFQARNDPFAHFPIPPSSIILPPPPPPAFDSWNLPGVAHKVAYVSEPPQQFSGGTRETTGQRMAGVLYNGQVWAILERDGGSYVVKPGDTVSGATVHAIGPSEMVVATSAGKQDVELRGLALPASAVAAASAVSPTQPGLPAWQPGYGTQAAGAPPGTTVGPRGLLVAPEEPEE